MSDGRAIVASYQPESVINNDIIMRNNIQSNWEYRKYLTDNGLQLMQQNYQEACNDAGCYAKSYEIQSSGNVIKDPMTTPFVYKDTNLTAQPFGYASSDLKTNYLSSQQLTMQKSVPGPN
jgi:hypothetical protein